MFMKTKRVLSVVLIAAVCAAMAMATGSCGRGSTVSAGNINNFGYLLVDGQHIFFTQVTITDFGYYSHIYRYHTVSKEEIPVARMEVDFPNEMNAFMSIHGNYLYFLPYFLHESMKEVSPNIYRVRTDGSNTTPEPLFDEEMSIMFMQIEGGLIYFYDDYLGALFSMNPDGSDRRVIAEAPMDSLTIAGGTVFFADNEHLMSVPLRGGEITEIFDFSTFGANGVFLRHIVAEGNYIYFSDDDFSMVGRIRNNGRSEPEIIYRTNPDTLEYVAFFNVSGNNVFMVVENFGPEQNFAILSVPVSGGEPRVIVSDAESLGDILPISIWNNVIYFAGMPIYVTVMDSDYVWFSVGVDGGRFGPWQPFSIADESAMWDDWGDDDWGW